MGLLVDLVEELPKVVARRGAVRVDVSTAASAVATSALRSGRVNGSGSRSTPARISCSTNGVDQNSLVR